MLNSYHHSHQCSNQRIGNLLINNIFKTNVTPTQRMENYLDFSQSQCSFLSTLNKQDSLKLQPFNLSYNCLLQENQSPNNLIHESLIQNGLIQECSINNLIQKNFFSDKVEKTEKDEKDENDENDEKDSIYYENYKPIETEIKNDAKFVEEKVEKKQKTPRNIKTIIPIFKPLYNEAAVFTVDSSKIQIIKKPTDYYNKIKEQILQAKHRVVLTALYIGIDQVDLVQTIHKALSECETLRVTILFDCLRGTRTSNSGESSVTLVAPLVTAFPDRVEVALYHTPELTKPLKMILPQRINEILGLFHAKIVVADDNLILAG